MSVDPSKTIAPATLVPPNFRTKGEENREGAETPEPADPAQSAQHQAASLSIEASDDGAAGKTLIRVSPGQVHLAAAAAEQVLIAQGTYFHAGGPIVRITKRDGADIRSEEVNDQTLYALLSAMADWERKGAGGGWARSNPDNNVIQILMRGQDRTLPLLAGLARQPFYRPDGTLVRSSGFDAQTCIYATFDEAEYDLPEPTRDEANKALDYIKGLLREFPFASAADQSAAIAAIITAAIRPSLSLAPAFNITASRSGSGKSYLAEIIALAAGPGNPQTLSYPTSVDEARKLLISSLLTNLSVVLFDDMSTDWKSLGPINSVLTSPTFTDRLLGSNRNATVSTRVLFLGTGNNKMPLHDLRRRVVTIRLTPDGETPALHTYEDNPVRHIRQNRAKLVQAALTIVEAYRMDGQTFANAPTIGSYDEWSTLCRYPLLWLDEPDPATSLIEQVRHDPDQDQLEEFLKVWHRLFDSEPMMTREIVAKAEQNRWLMEAIEDLPVMEGRYINRKKLGWYCRQNHGRKAGGLRLEPGPNSQRNTWRVVAG